MMALGSAHTYLQRYRRRMDPKIPGVPGSVTLLSMMVSTADANQPVKPELAWSRRRAARVAEKDDVDWRTCVRPWVTSTKACRRACSR